MWRGEAAFKIVSGLSGIFAMCHIIKWIMHVHMCSKQGREAAEERARERDVWPSAEDFALLTYSSSRGSNKM